MSKQASRKIEALGHIFDSALEYQRYLYLLSCEQDGLITDLKVHPSAFLLIPDTIIPSNHGTRPTRKKQAKITYTPDFSYMWRGIAIYEDTKGQYGNSKKNQKRGIANKPMVSPEARLRHKLFKIKLIDAYHDAWHFAIVCAYDAPVPPPESP